ncbi:rRNA maturation RNase YbeY [Clostridium sp. UBA1056]|uniref:rRNA maturation RNase YbeY n=1 Tax=unclassified Clostridium TaxID=2614128 RepID=UPI003217346B
MIYMDDRQSLISVEKDLKDSIKEIIDYALKEEQVLVPYEVSLIFVDNETIREINADTRGIDRTTDVLSFPMLDYEDKKVFKQCYLNYEFSPIDLNEGNLVLGDIVLSLERAKEQSEEFEHSFIREVCYLVIHSILHLLGYDHMEDEDKVIMRAREEEILSEFNIKRD